MEPLLLVCGGCGVKIRVTDPERARTRDCPRCASPLAPALTQALHQRSDVLTGTEPAQTPRRVGWVCAAASVLLASSLIILYTSTRPAASHAPIDLASGLTISHAIATATPVVAGSVGPEPRLGVLPESALAVKDDGQSAAVEPTPPFPTPTLVSSLALRDPSAAGPAPPLAPDPEPGDGDLPRSVLTLKPKLTTGPASPPVMDVPGDDPVPSDAPTPDQPRRLLVRDQNGKPVVAREHGMLKDQMAVVLPDGTIGWPTNQIFTDDKFVPATIDDLEQTLHNGEYATFRVVKTAHYLVFYQSSERFARDSADLLEKLYERLIPALRKQKAPVTEAEFPLVAVIFRSEDDFRANREVARDVQAYYEILSNRIFFFEKGKRDAAAPEVSAFRKPQTVAHEGTHQLLHNVGIQPRMSPWPIWLVEGLAEYCSPPRSTKKGGLAWDGLGQVNPIHLATIRDLDDPMSAQVRGGPKPPSARDRNQPLVEYLVTRTELTPTDYALSWGLAHYLAVKKVDQLFAYIRQLNQLRPFETRTPDQQLADFRAIFGKNLAKLDTQVADHLDKLKVPDAQALPFYAVLIAQPVARNSVRRMAMVSQSPSMIRQWFDEASNSGRNDFTWHVVPHPNRTRAMLTANTWVEEGR